MQLYYSFYRYIYYNNIIDIYYNNINLFQNNIFCIYCKN